MGASKAKSRKRSTFTTTTMSNHHHPMLHNQAEVLSMDSSTTSTGRQPQVGSPRNLKRSITPEDLATIASTPPSASLSTEELTSGSSEDEVASTDDLSSDSFVAKRKTAFRKTLTRKHYLSAERRQLSLVKEVDVAKYMTNRQMTVKQEHWNAYTMIPSPLFCVYYVLTARWMPSSSESAREFSLLDTYNMQHAPSAAACFAPSLFHSMPSLPPLSVLMVAAAIILHAPFSFVYHYQFAHRLRHPVERTAHLSRRLDQAMIHVASALMSYSTSGSFQYFMINCLYNAECVYRHLAILRVRPRANQFRIMVSMLAYTMPIWKYGHQPAAFFQVWLCFGLGCWFFIAYPIGGWSHSVFHLVVALAVPILMRYALTMPASQAALQQAVWCNDHGHL